MDDSVGWKFFSFFLYGVKLPSILKLAEESPQDAAVTLAFVMLRLYVFAELGELEKHG